MIALSDEGARRTTIPEHMLSRVRNLSNAKRDGSRPSLLTIRHAEVLTLHARPTFRLECTDSGGVSSSQTATDAATFDAFTCNSGSREARYIQVGVTDKYTPMFPIHFLAYNSDGTYHLSATAGMRTE